MDKQNTPAMDEQDLQSKLRSLETKVGLQKRAIADLEQSLAEADNRIREVELGGGSAPTRYLVTAQYDLGPVAVPLPPGVRLPGFFTWEVEAGPEGFNELDALHAAREAGAPERALTIISISALPSSWS